MAAFYNNVKEQGFSNIPSNTFSFWTSTEVDGQQAKAVSIINNQLNIYNSNKSSAIFVRAERNFN